MTNTAMTWLEALSYVVTILGFPGAIFTYIYEQRQSLANEKDELYRRLSEEYDNFLKLALDNADLLLFRKTRPSFNEEQMERRDVVFRMLVSLFEKAYIILFSIDMNHDTQRRWSSWEDDMREWCQREDFRTLLPELLEGEDDAFSQHILTIARVQTSG